jgi:small conductance mechanosensitive channel
MELNTVTKMIEKYTIMIVDFAPKLVGAIIVLLIGLWAIRRIGKILHRVFEKKNYDVSLESFLQSLVNIGLKVVLFLTVAGMVGLPTSSLFAILGAAGLAVGLALQGSLSNFAGGVLILIFKPYKVGDLVNLMDKFGEVKEIQIFNTIITTYDNKSVILPNGAVSNGVIQNHSMNGTIMADLRLKVDFGNDFEKVKTIILDVLSKDEKVLKNPAPSVNIINFVDYGMEICIRPHAKVSDYWDVHFKSLENIQKALVDNNVSGPRVTRFINNQL